MTYILIIALIVAIVVAIFSMGTGDSASKSASNGLLAGVGCLIETSYFLLPILVIIFIIAKCS